jgi:hypothetical protein
MGVPRERQVRAVGRRIGYDAVPDAVRDHVRDRFGAHKVLREHVGGMSPGCATSLATADGGRVFVKAVGQELHERTTDNFRREAELLRRLPDVDYRPRLLDMFEDVGGSRCASSTSTGRIPTSLTIATSTPWRTRSVGRLRR